MLTDEELREIRDKVAEAADTSGYDSLGWPQTYAEDVPRLLDEIERLRMLIQRRHIDISDDGLFSKRGYVAIIEDGRIVTESPER